jgi:hypothetical protein
MHKLLAVVFALVSTAAAGQAFPTKPVRFVSGVTPGSASDTMARLLAERLQTKWGQSVIVENRLGGAWSARSTSRNRARWHDHHDVRPLHRPTLPSPGAQPEGHAAGGDGGDDPDHPGRRAGRCDAGPVAAVKAQPGRLVCSTPASAARRT